MTLDKALIFGVHGVVAPMGGLTLWGDETIAGNMSGCPIVVSPSMCQAIDNLAGYHGAACFWLTDWTDEMRASMDPFPGSGWPSIAEPPAGVEAAREWAGDLWAACPWWKWWALDQWLDNQPDLRRLVWIDDELSHHRDSVGQRGPSRRACTIQTALHHAGIDATLIAPDKTHGLRPLDVQIIQEALHGAK